MSGPTGVMAPPSPGPAPAQRMPSPYSLPLHTLRLAGKCALPLITWFAAGEAVRFGLLYLGTEISHGDYRQVRLVLSVAVLTLVVMASMAVVSGMLYSLRSAMWEMRAREDDEPFWRAMDRVAPAYAVLYLAWGFQREDARDFVQMDWLHNVDQFLDETFLGNDSTVGRGLIDLDWRISLGAMAAAIGLRMLFSRMVEQGKGRFSGLSAAFSEFAVVFFGLNATMVFAKARLDWVEHRGVVQTSEQVLADAKEHVPGWESFWGAVGEVWPYVMDGVVVPLTWLTIAVLVYGAFADDARTALRGTRLERHLDRLETSHDLTQRSFNRFTGGFQERWVPLANSFRLTVKGGAALFGMMCLSYVVLHAGAEYALRGVRTLIGSETEWFWLVLGYPVDFVKSLLLTCLTMSLLAATFDIAATRARARGEAITS
ncbi:hypothetical protein [Nonomuraea typhae]|uniref:Uncharacterized protein n=1 Tax=Nonomuraea typhae TaxID=2603600 RepID=A0ABW7Z1E3_9ACTN